jgi:low temperature requirement protein LtrA
LVFAAIWWAWMSFTWFGNVFDTDDVPYRLWMLVMIAGSLGLAAGVPRIAELDFRIGVSSYVVMRLAYVAQWLRVLRSRDPTWRPIAWKVIVLRTVNQAGWLAFLYCPLEWRLPDLVDAAAHVRRHARRRSRHLAVTLGERVRHHDGRGSHLRRAVLAP